MPIFLRTVRENRWYKSEAAPWLERGDVPADPLGDLATSQNRLSVWEVAADRSNLERIVRAVAIGRQHLADTGYVLFDSHLLTAAEITTREEIGTTLDEGANAWHRDLAELSGNRLVALTKAILQNGESGTILKKRLRELVDEGIRQKQLPEKLAKLTAP
jgi:hypothetical protein